MFFTYGDPDDVETGINLERHPMPACCGITIVSNFGNTDHDENFGDHAPGVKEVEKELKHYLQQRRDAHYGSSAVQINLNDEQVTKFGKMLERCGFKELHTFYHAGHGNEITIYLWTAYERIRVARKGAA